MTAPISADEARIAAALAPFGWTCTPEFWQRYYDDAWVFNLANAVDRLAAENERLRAAASLAVTSLQAEHEPQWASDEMKARGKDPLGCVMCWPKDGGWPCNSRTEADDLAAALSGPVVQPAHVLGPPSLRP